MEEVRCFVRGVNDWPCDDGCTNGTILQGSDIRAPKNHQQQTFLGSLVASWSPKTPQLTGKVGTRDTYQNPNIKLPKLNIPKYSKKQNLKRDAMRFNTLIAWGAIYHLPKVSRL